MTRSFEDKLATRERVPLLVGLVGPSGSGKTFSALRLATGIRRVSGGSIFYLDTEARRALHYADRFQFRHIAFGQPFSPLDYLEAIDYCAKRGAGTIVIDSMSHEHEGPGGVLEMHAAEHARLGGKESTKMLAWSKPKQQRRRLINSMMQYPCNFICCFRAKEKVKLVAKKDRKDGEDAVQALGFMPIAGEEFVYEMTVNCLLYPGSLGVPEWHSQEVGERTMIKLPEQFRDVFKERASLSEDIGAALATWAAGGAVNRHGELIAAIRVATDPAALEQLVPLLEEAKKGRTVSPGEYHSLRAAYKARKDEFAMPQEEAPAPDPPAPEDDEPDMTQIPACLADPYESKTAERRVGKGRSDG